ncbi:MAG: class I SAM-dependent methyltransferase [Ktedonobacteraceae bacterium]
MIQKPKHLLPEYGKQFQDRSIVEAYHHRPPYPAEVFDILAGLIHGESRRVLDVGCGIGYIARNLVDRVEKIDAVDFSRNMIEMGKTLPNGDNPHLHWLFGSVEDVELDPPYALVTAGESLHWMDWNIVLPRFHRMLTPGGYLAIIQHNYLPDSWVTMLNEIIPRYTTNKDYYPYDMIEALESHGLFQKVGEKMTAPVPFVQSIDDYIESVHSRNGFSRDRMSPEQAAGFDREAKRILLESYSEGILNMQVVANIVWGIPQGE